MLLETEHKFLVISGDYREGAELIPIMQGYLSLDPERIVRVRMAGIKGYITVKGMQTCISRPEFEFEIPAGHAVEMIRNLCIRPVIEKDRFVVLYRGHKWEVDEFHGENEGLVVAEIELRSEDEAFEKPAWLGEEVTADPRYLNSNLVLRPYSSW